MELCAIIAGGVLPRIRYLRILFDLTPVRCLTFDYVLEELSYVPKFSGIGRILLWFIANLRGLAA